MASLGIKAEQELATALASFYDDPLGFVMFAYPWGMEKTADGRPNPLRHKKGPEPWQRQVLMDLGAAIKSNIILHRNMLERQVWKSAVASGHGVGKSALVAWLVQFFMSTRKDCRGVVTANTANQLETKTWPELAKWHNLIINKHWFTWTATTYYFTQYSSEQQKNYMFNAATVSENNTEAFQGLHNELSSVVVIFDEASGINSKIWEVAEGALTDGEAFFFAFGNPTQPQGDFADCFDEHAALYRTYHVDSRSVSHTNKSQLNSIIQKYGVDSDEAKIRVYGQFPSQSFNGFIGVETVNEAIRRELTADFGAALIMAVDVARFGDDESVIGFRQGRDARTRPMHCFKGLSTVRLAQMVADIARQERPDAIVIESTGPGAGVIDMLRENHHLRVMEIHPGAHSSDQSKYTRKRDEIWHLMRDWLFDIGCIADDPLLTRQLTSILYSYDKQTRTVLESKEAMKSRTGNGSPDRADCLALTFGVKLSRRDANNARRPGGRPAQAITEYDEYSH